MTVAALQSQAREIKVSKKGSVSCAEHYKRGTARPEYGFRVEAVACPGRPVRFKPRQSRNPLSMAN